MLRPMRTPAAFGAVALTLVGGCGGSAAESGAASAPVTPVAVAEESPVEENAAAPSTDLRDHAGLRWLPADANWVFLVDAARLRGRTFQAAMLARFEIPPPESVFPPEAWENVDAVLAGGAGDGGVAVVTGDLAGSRSAMEASAEEQGATRTTVGGREALVGDRLTFIAIDEGSWVLLFGSLAGGELAETSGPAVLSTPEAASLWETAAAGSPDAPALLEFFVSDGRGALADIDLLIRIGCAACDESLKLDSTVLYPDADTAARMATGFREMLQSVEDETSDLREMGVSSEDSYAHVDGRQLHIHQGLDEPDEAFHDGLAMMFMLGISLHPPNMGL